MFTKVRPKQELFLIHVVSGMPATKAYALAYGAHLSEATCAVNGSKLLKQTKITQRRNELVAAYAARQPISVEFLTRELMATAGESRALGQGSAAAACYMGAAKLNGMIVDRVQSDVLVRKPSATPESPDDMSPEQWLGEYALTIEHEPHNNGLSDEANKGSDLEAEARSLGLVEPEP
jgi:hypothetical protein